MELYYKPNNRGGARITITDEMTDEAKAAQRAIAAAQGLLPVSNATPKPAPGPFGTYIEKMSPVTDEYGGIVGYSQSWEFHATRIRLSQEKILTSETIAPILPQLIQAFSSDEQLAGWWANDMTYVRGSAMAQRAMQVLGLTQEQLEQLALRCRA